MKRLLSFWRSLPRSRPYLGPDSLRHAPGERVAVFNNRVLVLPRHVDGDASRFGPVKAGRGGPRAPHQSRTA